MFAFLLRPRAALIAAVVAAATAGAASASPSRFDLGRALLDTPANPPLQAARETARDLAKTLPGAPSVDVLAVCGHGMSQTACSDAWRMIAARANNDGVVHIDALRADWPVWRALPSPVRERLMDYETLQIRTLRLSADSPR